MYSGFFYFLIPVPFTDIFIFQVKPRLADPIDFEEYVSKNKVMLNNDTLRELLMYPADDISVSIIGRPMKYGISSQ